MRVLEELCRDACVQLSPCRKEELEIRNSLGRQGDLDVPDCPQVIKQGEFSRVLPLHPPVCCGSSWLGHHISLAPTGCRCVCHHLVPEFPMLCFVGVLFRLWFCLLHYFSGYGSDGEMPTANHIFFQKQKKVCQCSECTPC